MQAPRIDAQTLPPPPGILGSLRTGFDAIATHVTVVLVPLALDLLLWLGPRLSMDRLMQPFLSYISDSAVIGGLKAEDIHNLLDSISSTQKFLQAFNLLGMLRTFPIGIFSLMSSVLPTHTPWGTEAVVEIGSASQLLALMFALTVAGWMLGGLYFRWVAALATPGAAPEDRSPVGRAVLQSVVYALIWSLAFWMIGLPVALLLYVAFAINSLLGEGVLLVLGFLSMWLIVPIFFSPHGIFVKKQNAFASILSGFQMTRFTMPTSSLFVLTALLLGIGLNFLWATPKDGSWLVLVGILGHAFITTALLASSFVYYHNMTAWLQIVLTRMRSSLPAQRA